MQKTINQKRWNELKNLLNEKWGKAPWGENKVSYFNDLNKDCRRIKFCTWSNGEDLVKFCKDNGFVVKEYSGSSDYKGWYVGYFPI